MTTRWTWDRHFEQVYAQDPNAGEVARFPKAFAPGVSLQRVVIRFVPYGHDGGYRQGVDWQWNIGFFTAKCTLESSSGPITTYAYEMRGADVSQRIQNGSDPDTYQRATAVFLPIVWDFEPHYKNVFTTDQVVAFTFEYKPQDLEVTLQTKQMSWEASVQFDALFSQVS